MSQFFEELKRRKVFRVGAVYLVAAWLLLQVSETLVPILNLPGWVSKLVFFLLAIGFVPALILAWAFELTPGGIKPDGEVERAPGNTNDGGRKLDYLVIGILAITLVGAGGFWLKGRDARWARDEAIPQIEEYVGAGLSEQAYALAKQVEAALPDNPSLAELWGAFSWRVTIPSVPPGATVYRRPYSATDDDWEKLGTTPLHDIHLPFGLSLIRLELDGHPPLLRVIGGGLTHKRELIVEDQPTNLFANVNPDRFILDTNETLPAGMVRVPGWTEVWDGESAAFRDFFIGRYEVTNDEFKDFVDEGGYRRRDLWEHDFVRGEGTIPWEEAMALFTDKTGRPGPASWVGGTFADGEDELPVAGVSWYEAAAYARFVGQELPTWHHWRRAFAAATLGWMVPASNIQSDAAAPVGQYQGIGWTGTFDMIGNVREWCFNAIGDQRIIVGGGWNDEPYIAAGSVDDAGNMQPLDRSATNGFRLAVLSDEAVATKLARQALREWINDPLDDPVSDEVFAAYLRDYDYDPTPLNAIVEATEAERYWTRERISIDTAYGGEPITLYLYLPLGDATRYQTIIYWPEITAFYLDSIDRTRFRLDFAVKNGRAVAFPVFKGTYERRHSEQPEWWTIAGRDLAVQQIKDLRRTIDYLESRADIDAGSIAYYGHSWGGRIGAIALTVESRLRTGILDQAGIYYGIDSKIAAVHYLPRVKVPVLQFNGRFDTDYPYETAAKPFFDLLGTPAADKKHVVEPTGHFVPQPVVIGETLSWLDKYLGPPNN